MKLISRSHYLNQLSGVINTPDIKIVTGIRRSGKSKLLNAFANHIRQIDSTANVIEIDLTKLRFENLKEKRSRSLVTDKRCLSQTAACTYSK